MIVAFLILIVGALFFIVPAVEILSRSVEPSIVAAERGEIKRRI